MTSGIGSGVFIPLSPTASKTNFSTSNSVDEQVQFAARDAMDEFVYLLGRELHISDGRLRQITSYIPEQDKATMLNTTVNELRSKRNKLIFTAFCKAVFTSPIIIMGTLTYSILSNFEAPYLREIVKISAKINSAKKTLEAAKKRLNTLVKKQKTAIENSVNALNKSIIDDYQKSANELETDKKLFATLNKDLNSRKNLTQQIKALKSQMTEHESDKLIRLRTRLSSEESRKSESALRRNIQSLKSKIDKLEIKVSELSSKLKEARKKALDDNFQEHVQNLTPNLNDSVTKVFSQRADNKAKLSELESARDLLSKKLIRIRKLAKMTTLWGFKLNCLQARHSHFAAKELQARGGRIRARSGLRRFSELPIREQCREVGSI